MWPECRECGGRQNVVFLEGSNMCFGSCKMDHKIRNFPTIVKNEGDNHRWAQPYPFSCPSGSREQDRFCALDTQKDHEVSQMQ